METFIIPQSYLFLNNFVAILGNNKYRIEPYREYFTDLRGDIEDYPAENLSKILGIKLHQDWGINTPNNKKKIFEKKDIEFLYSTYPELSIIKILSSYDSATTDWYIYNGCLSKFNFEDIRYFCEVHYEKRDKEIDKFQEKLENKMNYAFQFVPSIETLKKIEQHLKHNKIRVNEKLLKRVFL